MVLLAGMGVVSAALFPTMASYLTRSRDAARISHLKDISTALGAYYADNGKYPDPTPGGCVPSDALTLGKYSYMPRGMPVDPNHLITPGCSGEGGMTYAYRVLSDASGIQHFILSALLENTQSGNSFRPLIEYNASEFLSPMGPSLVHGT